MVIAWTAVGTLEPQAFVARTLTLYVPDPTTPLSRRPAVANAPVNAPDTSST
jgi:hypothetical protein